MQYSQGHRKLNHCRCHRSQDMRDTEFKAFTDNLHSMWSIFVFIYIIPTKSTHEVTLFQLKKRLSELMDLSRNNSS